MITGSTTALSSVGAPRLGDLYPLPEFSASTVDGFQGTMRSVTLQDTAVNELWGSSPVSTQAVGTHEHDQIRLYVVLRGAVTLRDPHDQGRDASVPAGTYFLMLRFCGGEARPSEAASSACGRAPVPAGRREP
ncbi:hypothetical protein SPURM210S_06732 [Streptomyces purpurascens]|nr:hypothetical protein GCM10010303_09500 [Streptomyces purpurascens]